jgi:uncharacterized protein (TIGR02117 family)
MRRAARLLGQGIAAILAVFLIAALVSVRFGDRQLYPPAAGEPTITTYVVNHGYHAGLTLPRAALERVASRHAHRTVTAVTTRFGAYGWIEFGWGDEGFYRTVPTVAALTAGTALRALFMPGNASVLHVVGLRHDPPAAFPTLDMVPVVLSEAGFERLVARLEGSFAQGPDNQPPADLGPGLYGPSLFYRGDGTFSILRVCNHWVADLLDAAGVPTAPVVATLPRGLLLDLRWRSSLSLVER